eukprot:2888496-Amphidinium_carterae.1
MAYWNSERQLPSDFCLNLEVQSADWRKSESPGYVCAEETREIELTNTVAIQIMSSGKELAIEPHGNTCPRLFVGMFVEFWSERNQYWMPTEVKHSAATILVLNMDAETGA